MHAECYCPLPIGQFLAPSASDLSAHNLDAKAMSLLIDALVCRFVSHGCGQVRQDYLS